MLPLCNNWLGKYGDCLDTRTCCLRTLPSAGDQTPQRICCECPAGCDFGSVYLEVQNPSWFKEVLSVYINYTHNKSHYDILKHTYNELWSYLSPWSSLTPLLTTLTLFLVPASPLSSLVLHVGDSLTTLGLLTRAWMRGYAHSAEDVPSLQGSVNCLEALGEEWGLVSCLNSSPTACTSTF